MAGESSTVVYTPDSNNGGSVPAWLAYNNGGLGNGFGGLGGGILGFLLGLFFGNGGWGNGFGGFGGGWGGNSGAGFLSNQINNDSGRELLMNAITSQGEAGRAATQNLATMLGQDFNLVNSGIQTIQGALSSLALQQAVSVPQIINAIQSGNASLASDLCRCCCEQRQLTVEQGYQNQIATLNQTNALTSAIAGVNENIAANRAAQQLSDCQQTYALTDTMNRNYLALDNKIDALESSRKDREITALTAKVAQLESQNFTTGIVGSALAPVNAALSAIAKEVDDIKCKQPSTVSVQYPNLVALNATPYVSGGYYQGGFNGLYGSGLPGFGGFNF